jgi:hypothetical protein
MLSASQLARTGRAMTGQTNAAPAGAAEFVHEHLLRINDPTLLIAERMDRAGLWAGLRATLEHPDSLDATIDSLLIEAESASVLRRTMWRGAALQVERLQLIDGESIALEILEGPFAGSTMNIRIEEPSEGALFVRVVHRVLGLPADRTAEEDRALRSAYELMNIDRIRVARAGPPRARN